MDDPRPRSRKVSPLTHDVEMRCCANCACSGGLNPKNMRVKCKDKGMMVSGMTYRKCHRPVQAQPVEKPVIQPEIIKIDGDVVADTTRNLIDLACQVVKKS